MLAFKRILVPVDFSSCSGEAIRVGAELSTRFAAELCIVHVYEPAHYALPQGFPLYTPGQLENLLGVYARQLEAAKQDAEAAGALRVQTQQLQGVVATEIVGYAKEHGFDLIVMGTHGRTGLQHALVGSVAEKVVRRAPCSVLTVRTRDHKG